VNKGAFGQRRKELGSSSPRAAAPHLHVPHAFQWQPAREGYRRIESPSNDSSTDEDPDDETERDPTRRRLDSNATLDRRFPEYDLTRI
jgi:hypothetical protein